MASLCSFNASSSSSSFSSCQHHFLSHPLKLPLSLTHSFTLPRNTKKKSTASVWPLFCALNNNPLQYRNLGDSDLNISEITLGTVSHPFSYFRKREQDCYCYRYSFVRFHFGWYDVVDFRWPLGSKTRRKKLTTFLGTRLSAALTLSILLRLWVLFFQSSSAFAMMLLKCFDFVVVVCFHLIDL